MDLSKYMGGVSTAFAPVVFLLVCCLLTSRNAAGQVPPSLYPPPAMIAGTVPTGDSPSAVAVNPATHDVYIANVGDQTLTVLDGFTLQTLATLPLGLGPYSIAVDPITYRIYVANGSSQTLTVIDGTKNAITTTIPVTNATVLTAVVVDSLLGQIYVLSYGGYLSIISAKTNATVSVVQVGAHSQAMALNYFNHKLYIASYDLGTVTVLNSQGLTVGYVKDLGSMLTAIAVDPYADCAFVVSQGNKTVTRINGEDSYSKFTYTGFISPVSIAFDPDGGVMYVGDGGINQVSMVASGNNTISRSNLPVLTADSLAVDSAAGQLDIATHANYVMALDLVLDPTIFIYNEFPTGASPYAIAVDPITHRSFITNQLDNTVTVFDAAQHTITTTPPNVPMQATAVDVNPVTGTLYFLNPSLETVTSVAEGRFGTDNYLVTATIPVGSAQGNLAVNPVTNRIYVPNTGGGAISIIDGTTNAVTQVTGLPAFAAPFYAVVDPATNQVFAADFVKGLIYVIDGASGAVVKSVAAPGTTGILAINPAAANVYTPGPNSLDIFDEISGSTASIPLTTAITSLAVNTTTNQIIVSNSASPSTITVINGGANRIAGTFTSPFGVTGLGVNPLNNKIYVLANNQSAGHVFVYDGSSFAQIADVPVGSGPVAIGFNPLLNLAYVASTRVNYLTVIDGATEATEILYADGSNTPSTGGSVALAFDPVLNMLSAAGYGEVTATRPSALFTPSDTVPPPSGPRILIQAVPVPDSNTIATTPLFRTSAATVMFNVSADSDGTTNAVPELIYYQVDQWSGAWNYAKPTTEAGTRRAGGTLTTPALSRGLHYLYVWSGTPDVSTVQSNGANQNSSVVSRVTAVAFSIEPAENAASISAVVGSNQTTLAGQPFESQLEAQVMNAANQPVPGVAVTFSLPASGSSATFSGLTSATAITGSNGRAVSPLPVANLVLGNYAALASAPGAAALASFTLANVNTMGPPTVVSLSPASGTGLTQTFSMAYADPKGEFDLSAVLAVFNTSVKLSGACAVVYVPGANQMYLYNDAGTMLSMGITPGSSGSVSNSQCILAGAGSSVGTSLNSVTLNAALTFTGTFTGVKNVYLYANGKTSNSGWLQKGTWTPSSAGPPTVVSLSPTSGTGLTQTFTMVYSDPNGLSDLSYVLAVFNTSVKLSSACAVIYVLGTNQMYLYNDAGTGLSAGVTPGSVGSVSNSQCTLAGTGSSVTTSGNNVTLNVALTFTGTFTGQQNVYLYAIGKTANSGWLKKGTWTP
jgi:YVTN family beta-propeller protein